MNVWPIIDKRCGKVAFYYTEEPDMDSVIESAKVVYRDGRKAMPGTPAICESCGGLVCFVEIGVMEMVEWN